MRPIPACVMVLSILCIAAAPATRPARPYETAHDRPLNATIRQMDQTRTYTQFRVEFDGILRDRVPALVYVPRDGRRKHPGVLLQYGSGGNKKTNYIVAIGEQFVKHGFVVITIDIPNRGERRHEKSIIEGNFLETLGDYSRAVDYLSSRADVDTRRIAYMGISWGAITGITYVAHDPRIRVMASLVGGGNFIGWMPPAMVTDEMRREDERFDPVYHVALIEPRPLLLMNVLHDQLVPRFMSDSLQKAAGPTAEKRWVDTDHFFSTVDRYELAEDVIRWIQKRL